MAKGVITLSIALATPVIAKPNAPPSILPTHFVTQSAIGLKIFSPFISDWNSPQILLNAFPIPPNNSPKCVFKLAKVDLKGAVIALNPSVIGLAKLL